MRDYSLLRAVRCSQCQRITTRKVREEGGYGVCSRCGGALVRPPSLAARADAKAKDDLARMKA